MPRKHGRTNKKIHEKKVGLKEQQTLFIKEQVILSKERTILSFIRTALAAIGAGVVLISVFPGNYTIWIMGWALILIGLVELFESYRRMKHYRDEMKDIKKRLGKDWV
jgi:uncharacterized membrane protein YidH (DUF202 family)